MENAKANVSSNMRHWDKRIVRGKVHISMAWAQIYPDSRTRLLHPSSTPYLNLNAYVIGLLSVVYMTRTFTKGCTPYMRPPHCSFTNTAAMPMPEPMHMLVTKILAPVCLAIL
jgi:hypothetical protein